MPMIGEIRMFAIGRTPAGWLACDGSEQSIAEFDELFMLLGTTYGGDGAQTFGLPDLRGRVPVHQGAGSGLSPRLLGQSGGSETIALNVSHLPAHSHPYLATTELANATAAANNLLAVPADNDKMYLPSESAKGRTPAVMSAASTTPAGNSTPTSHENTMPTLTVSYCIAAKGVFPSRS